jgi:hypothetical protein
MTVAGCGTGPAPTVAVQSPVDTAIASFQALNNGDMALADAHWEPDRLGAGSEDPPPHGDFQNLECRSASGAYGEPLDTATTASVACTFTIREVWDGFSPGFYGWGVYMRRQPPGPWLIYDEGQG